MGKVTVGSKVNTEGLLRMLNPTAAAIVREIRASDIPLSAKALSERLDLPLANLAYHCVRMRKANVLRVAKTTYHRGAVAKHYALNQPEEER